MHETRQSFSSHHITFDEVSEQVHHLKDVILWDVQRGFEMQCQYHDTDEASFSNHLMFTKFWFIRVSSVNKKRFCLMLLEHDITCAWTLSLLLKSIWNCRLKDAVASQAEGAVCTSYDQIPMDHNRTAVPLEVLVEVMELDRKFFRSLEPWRKAEFLLELLKISGGPNVWAVFHKAQIIFDNYREEQLENLQDSVAVIDKKESFVVKPPLMEDKSKKNPPRKGSVGGIGDGGTPLATTRDGERELAACLDRWRSIIKSLKDSQKLEEVELSYIDGTKKRIWKINRPKPEVTETVDYVQLLPQGIAKRILNFVPRAQLADCARVNRYWAYLVDDFKAELAARLKIDLQLEKLTEIMLRHDTMNQSMDTFKTTSSTSYSAVAARRSRRPLLGNFSKHTSQRSATTNVFKCILRETKIKLPPIRNLAELSGRLNRRGAADDSLKDWCKALLEQYNPARKRGVNLPPIKSAHSSVDGIMDFGNILFPCPLMGMNLTIPLKPPLFKDPAATSYKKKTSNVNAARVIVQLDKMGDRRYNLWSRDFSSLYTASKIASYKSPV